MVTEHEDARIRGDDNLRREASAGIVAAGQQMESAAVLLEGKSGTEGQNELGVEVTVTTVDLPGMESDVG